MKNLLITGASGFVGSFLVEEALNRNYNVFAAIRKSSSKQYLKDERINFIELDFSNRENLKKSLGDQNIKFDFIIHNAGLTQARSNKELYDVNFEFTKNFVEVLLETGKIPLKFIYTGSLASYGPGSNHNIVPIKLADNPNPISSYGKSKWVAQKYLTSLNDLPYLIFMPTAVYGPREKNLFTLFKLINKGFEGYIGFQKQHLTFIFVKDLVKLVLDSLESPHVRKSYFVSDDGDYSTEMLNSFIRKSLNKKTFKIRLPLPLVKVIAFFSENISNAIGNPSVLNSEKIKEFESLNWLCDIEPIKRDFNFSPQYDLEKGIKETAEWYRNQKWL